MIRAAGSDADFELCAAIKNEIEPNHPVAAEQMRDAKRDGEVLLHGGGGYAYVAPSSVVGGAFAMVRVALGARKRGIGSGLLAAAAAHARSLGLDTMWGRIRAEDEAALGFASRRGYVEIDREVELVRTLAPGDGAEAEGVVELRDEHREGAYGVAVQCIPDMPLTAATAARSFESWTADELSGPACFVALDGDAVVGYAALRDVPAMPQRLEHGLTAVLRTHRGRGVATRLKLAQIAWAAAHGYRELVTTTHQGNAAMRAVNRRLGYVEGAAAIVVSGSLDR